jgi:hypothetical protein
LLAHIEDGANLDWQLDQLLDVEEHREPEMVHQKYLKFHRAFRNALYESDRGFPYHHWLLSRLPWTSIITTNFDAFHERAAADAARLPWLADDDRERILRLATTAPDSGVIQLAEIGRWLNRLGDDLIQGQNQSMMELDVQRSPLRGALFKPYGSLYRPGGQISFSKKEISDRNGFFRAALHQSIQGARGGLLLVIGHAMKDRFIEETLIAENEQLKKLNLIWVDPLAYQRCCETDTGITTQPFWPNLLWKLGPASQGDDSGLTPSAEDCVSGPVPATALDFAYDLWRMYSA